MAGLLPLLFVAVSGAEILLFMKIGGAIGAGYTVFCVIATGIVGGWLARQQGTAALIELREAMVRGAGIGSAVLAGVLLLVAAVLLITPGFLTDFLGFSLLIPKLRALLAGRLHRRLREHLVVKAWPGSDAPPPGVIDVE